MANAICIDQIKRAERGKSLAPFSSDDLNVDGDAHIGEKIDIVVAQLKRLMRMASLELALRVGAVIIHHFYDGDTDAWRSRGPKTASFRRLARHPELPLSAGSLYRCVALFELCERLNAPSRWERLGASHLRLVIGLPHDVQERLLKTANSERWTVKVLQQHALEERGSRSTFGGRRAEPVLTRSLRRVQRCLEEHSSLVDQADLISALDAQRCTTLIEDARRCLERLADNISRKACDTGGSSAGHSARLVEGGVRADIHVNPKRMTKRDEQGSAVEERLSLR